MEFGKFADGEEDEARVASVESKAAEHRERLASFMLVAGDASWDWENTSS